VRTKQKPGAVEVRPAHHFPHRRFIEIGRIRRRRRGDHQSATGQQTEGDYRRTEETVERRGRHVNANVRGLGLPGEG
jgi:hypothetical protein